MNATNTSILVVDDEPDLASLYEQWLAADHDVEVAVDGRTGLEKATAADIVFLDRNLPGLTGPELLESLREGGHDCRVVMVTAIDPDFDIVEMGFDDYLLKPVTCSELRTAVERMVRRETYQESLREFYALASKKAILETEKSPAELHDSEAYADLEARFEAVRADVDAAVGNLESDWPLLLNDIIDDRADPPRSSV
jgi:DNA-binding response OmpR family regulator